MSYSANIVEQYRRAAVFVDKMLKVDLEWLVVPLPARQMMRCFSRIAKLGVNVNAKGRTPFSDSHERQVSGKLQPTISSR